MTYDIIITRFSLFWDVTQYWLVVSYWRYETSYRSRFQGTSSLFFLDCLIIWIWEPIDCFATSMTKYKSTLSNIAEERGSHLHLADLSFVSNRNECQHCVMLLYSTFTHSPVQYLYVFSKLLLTKHGASKTQRNAGTSTFSMSFSHLCFLNP
jgi:hypothetical protein